MTPLQRESIGKCLVSALFKITGMKMRVNFSKTNQKTLEYASFE